MSDSPAHPEPDENPEECIGEEIPDPWADEEQADWPQGEVSIDGVGGGA